MSSDADEVRAARYADLFEGNHEHVSDCAYCPFCTAIGLVRRQNPEIMEHLATAAREFVLAAGLLLTEAGEMIGSPDVKRTTRPTEEKGDGGKVRRIDIV